VNLIRIYANGKVTVSWKDKITSVILKAIMSRSLVIMATRVIGFSNMASQWIHFERM